MRILALTLLFCGIIGLASFVSAARIYNRRDFFKAGTNCTQTTPECTQKYKNYFEETFSLTGDPKVLRKLPNHIRLKKDL